MGHRINRRRARRPRGVQHGDRNIGSMSFDPLQEFLLSNSCGPADRSKRPVRPKTRLVRPSVGCTGRFVALLLFVGAVAGSRPTWAEDANAERAPVEISDQEVMATYFFRLVNFYEWPGHRWPEAGRPVDACVLGRDPFGRRLDAFAGRTIRGRTFSPRRLANIDEIDGCHLLFIGEDGRARIQSILQQLANRSILTVGLGPEFVRLGGSVGFVADKRRIRLVVNPSASQRCGLEVSSKILEVSSVFVETR